MRSADELSARRELDLVARSGARWLAAARCRATFEPSPRRRTSCKTASKGRECKGAGLRQNESIWHSESKGVSPGTCPHGLQTIFFGHFGGGMARAFTTLVSEQLAVVAEPDWAMRELIRFTLEPIGFSILECSSSTQLSSVLRAEASRSALCVFVVATGAIASDSRAPLATLGKERAAMARTLPFVLTTCEFGTLESYSRPKLVDCVPVGLLEKPFDFALLHGIAERCRGSPAQAVSSPGARCGASR